MIPRPWVIPTTRCRKACDVQRLQGARFADTRLDNQDDLATYRLSREVFYPFLGCAGKELFVNLRHLAGNGQSRGPRIGSRSSSASSSRSGDSKKISVRSSSFRSVSSATRAFLRAGRKPRKVKASLALAGSTQRCDEGTWPGNRDHWNPALMRLPNDTEPGSEIQGVPASLTNAICSPLSSLSSSSPAFSFSLCSW